MDKGKMSEKNIVREVKKGIEENIVVKTERMNIAVDLGAAERERFLAVKRVVTQTERDLDAGASSGSAKQEAQ